MKIKKSALVEPSLKHKSF